MSLLGFPLAVRPAALVSASFLVAVQELTELPPVQSTRLLPSESASGDVFGADLAVDGFTVAVVASSENFLAIFDETSSGWLRGAELEFPASTPIASVALRGDTLAVGLLRSGSGGSVAVFQRDAGGRDAWGEVWSSLSPPFPFSHRTFGHDVALDGEHLFVSDPMQDLPPFPSGPGAVFAFRAVEGGSWDLVETLWVEGAFDYGRTIAADADRLAVAESGKVWIWARTPGEDDWDIVQCVDGAASEFGLALDLQGDLLLVGEPSLHSSRAYLYQRDQGGPEAWGLVTTFFPEPGPPYRFGSAVAIGTSALYVGASASSPSPDPSVVHSFVRDPSVPSGWRAGIVFQEPHATPTSSFGFALSARGRLLAAGTPFANSFRGRAYALRVHQTAPALAPPFLAR